MTHEGPASARPDRWVVDASAAGVRLDVFLAAAGRLGSRGRATWALERGKVLLNDRECWPEHAGSRLREGDSVRVWMDRPGSARARRHRVEPADRGRQAAQVVYEDGAVIVVNKPPGLLSVPLARRSEADSVASQLLGRLRGLGKRKPLVVHRIDRDTSGLVVFAMGRGAQQALRGQFERREPERVYLAVVAGVPEPEAGEWRDHLAWDERSLSQTVTARGTAGAKESVCGYRVIERLADGRASLLEIRLETGRRNQIRAQAARHGHPLLGERMYKQGANPLDYAPMSRQALHAWRLKFDHPESGRPLEFEAPMPEDFKDLLAALKVRREDRVRGRSPKKMP